MNYHRIVISGSFQDPVFGRVSYAGLPALFVTEKKASSKRLIYSDNFRYVVKLLRKWQVGF